MPETKGRTLEEIEELWEPQRAPLSPRRSARNLMDVPEQIRVFGDPVLKTKAAPVADVDGKAARLVDKMFDALYGTDNGLALAAPQIGVQKQVVVWDFGEDPLVVFNPEIVESDGEWVYEEGCLSIPGPVRRDRPPEAVSTCAGIDRDGNPVEWEADELEARMFQHELDHLNGVLMFDRMTPEQRKEALAEYRRLQEATSPRAGSAPAPAPALNASCAWPILGTPELAVPPLRALVEAGHDVVARRHPRRPPQRAGRCDVAEPREGGGARTRHACHPRPSDDVLTVGAELGVVVAFGRIIPPHVLAAAADGQPALLAAPSVAWRGAGRAGAAGR